MCRANTATLFADLGSMHFRQCNGKKTGAHLCATSGPAALPDFIDHLIGDLNERRYKNMPGP